MGKRIRLNSKDRSGILSLYNKKGYRRGKRGQPKLNKDLQIGLVVKVVQFQRRYNLSGFKAWLKITKLKAFPDILKDHFKNRKGSSDWWIRRFNKPESETGIRQNFYRNHLRAHISKNK